MALAVVVVVVDRAVGSIARVDIVFGSGFRLVVVCSWVAFSDGVA